MNKQTDEQTCGTCGVHCATSATCTSGVCVCPAATPDLCSEVCVSKQTDEQNCGTCANVCATGATCTSGTCQCPAGPQLGCGGGCCAGGDACCVASCQTQHANGLGQFYYDCGSLDEHTHAQAGLAALAWSASGSTWEAGLACGSCLCRQSATQAAVWCYAGSPMKGLVQVTASPNCLAAACPINGSAQAWH